MLTFIKLFLANKTLTVILLTYGITAGLNWWDNYEKQLEWKSAMESYQAAFASAQEQLQRNDAMMKKRLIAERERHEKNTAKTIGLYKVARQEVQKGLGGPCGPFADVVVPAYYFDVLRTDRQPREPSTSRPEYRTARQWLADKLQAATGGGKAEPDPGAVRKKPADGVGPAQLHDKR